MVRRIWDSGLAYPSTLLAEHGFGWAHAPLPGAGTQLVARAIASPGFLVAGWRIIVQVGLALLYSIQDELGDMETLLDGKACARHCGCVSSPDRVSYYSVLLVLLLQAVCSGSIVMQLQLRCFALSFLRKFAQLLWQQSPSVAAVVTRSDVTCPPDPGSEGHARISPRAC